MLIGDVIKKYPESVEVMLNHGIQCVGCHIAMWETIKQSAESHRIDADKLIEDINKKLKGENDGKYSL